MSAYEGSKMQEADEAARLRPGDKGYRAPSHPAVVSPVVRSIEELRAKLRREVEACDIVIAALGGEP